MAYLFRKHDFYFCTICYFHQNAEIENSAFLGAFRILGIGTIYSLGYLWIIISTFAIGQYILRYFNFPIHKVSEQIISIAVGCSILGTLLTILGLFYFLNSIIVWILTIIPIIIFHKKVIEFLQSIFLKPVVFNHLTLLKTFPLFIISIFLSAGFISAFKPFPIGFDGSGLYLNLSSLIAQYQGLPQGHQAFNASVFFSLGELLFDNKTINLIISHFSIFLVLVVIYRLARLIISPSNSWLALAIFYTLPVVTYQTVREEKVDFFLTFIILSSFLWILESHVFNSKNDKKSIYVWAISGGLLGYAFGIKYLSIYGIVALIVLWAYRQGGKFAAMGSLSFLTFILFLGGLNKWAYLDISPQHLLWIKFILLFVSVVCFLNIFLQKRTIFNPKKIQSLFLFLISIIIPFLPWAFKNISEHKSISTAHILTGKSANPEIKPYLKLFADEEDLYPLTYKKFNSSKFRFYS